MDIDLSRFRATFFQEAAEHLETMETDLLALQSAGADAESLHRIFRCAHSMKAGAGMFGLDAVGRFTHVLESVLDKMRNREMDPSPARVESLLRSVDLLRSMLAVSAEGNNEAPAEMEQVMAALAETGRTYAIGFEPSPTLFGLGLDPFLVLRDLAQLGSLRAVEVDLSRLPHLDAMDTATCYLGWHLRLETPADMEQIRDVFAFVEDVATVSIALAGTEEHREIAQAATAASVARAPVADASLRVSTEKVDRLIDLVGELTIAQSMATQIMDGFTPSRLQELQEAVATMARYTHELQDRAMRIRMMPVGTVFSRFPRVVHDAARTLGKQVAIHISGEDTELDKGMVERMADPLLHLVRNAVDHGIETAEARRSAGKSEEGSLTLTAYHQSGNVIIEVGDDGGGLDTARIREKAIERGLIGRDEELSQEQIQALIFRPGFSTAEAVTDLSGRGVGMDVVKKGVEALNGAVSVDSRAGRGTTFRMKLPLTLAVLDGLLLKVGEQTYVLPLTSIVESIRPRPEAVRGVAGCGEVVVVRKEPLPLLRLHRLFAVPTEVLDPGSGLVVIMEHEGDRKALLVDEIVGQQQVVVKSLEANYRKVTGITGATILGDGRAALILDVAGIFEMSRACGDPAAAA